MATNTVWYKTRGIRDRDIWEEDDNLKRKQKNARKDVCASFRG